MRERVEKLLLETARRAVGEVDAARGASISRIAVDTELGLELPGISAPERI